MKHNDGCCCGKCEDAGLELARLRERNESLANQLADELIDRQRRQAEIAALRKSHGECAFIAAAEYEYWRNAKCSDMSVVDFARHVEP